MGGQNYKNFLENQFLKKVDEIVKDSETVEEAIERAEEVCTKKYGWNTAGLDYLIEDNWNEVHGVNHG